MQTCLIITVHIKNDILYMRLHKSANPKFNYLYLYTIMFSQFTLRDAMHLNCTALKLYIHTKYCTKYTCFIHDILYINNTGDLASNISVIFVDFRLKSIVRDCCLNLKL